MNDETRAILQSLLNEIEDLRAGQVVLFASLETQPHFSQTNFANLKREALAKNRGAYEALRQTIDELT